LTANPKIILIDNEDSFTYNIVQVIQSIGHSVSVMSYTNIDLERINEYNNIIISPGPDVPSAYPNIFKLLDRYKINKKILGICLGCQAIGEYFGAQLKQMSYPMHGIKSLISVDTDDILYKNIGKSIEVGRYHSWIIDNSTLPFELQQTAIDTENSIMSISHNLYNIKGVQYHPESIMTPRGADILHNWIESD
jgi:anthranilate synthase component 2